MKTRLLTISFLSLIFMHLCSPLSMGASVNGIAAVVNGKVITRSEVREAVEAQEQMIRMTIRDTAEQQSRLSELHDKSLDALIERELVLSEFEKMGGTIKPEYVEDEINNIVRQNFGGDRDKFIFELTKSGMTLKRFRDLQEKMIIVQVMKQRQLKGLTPPTPAEVDAFYSKNSEKFRDKDYIKMSTITIPKYPSGDSAASPESQKKIVEEIRTKISGGAEFAQMARTYSQDSRAANGGSWSGESGSADFIERSTLDKSIAEVAFSLKPGGISKVLEIGPVYMLILCEAKRPGTSTPLDKVRPDIEKFIKAERGRGALNGWLVSIARKSTIQPDSVRDTFLKHVSNKN